MPAPSQWLAAGDCSEQLGWALPVPEPEFGHGSWYLGDTEPHRCRPGMPHAGPHTLSPACA